MVRGLDRMLERDCWLTISWVRDKHRCASGPDTEASWIELLVRVRG